MSTSCYGTGPGTSVQDILQPPGTGRGRVPQSLYPPPPTPWLCSGTYPGSLHHGPGGRDAAGAAARKPRVFPPRLSRRCVPDSPRIETKQMQMENCGAAAGVDPGSRGPRSQHEGFRGPGAQHEGSRGPGAQWAQQRGSVPQGVDPESNDKRAKIKGPGPSRMNPGSIGSRGGSRGSSDPHLYPQKNKTLCCAVFFSFCSSSPTTGAASLKQMLDPPVATRVLSMT